MQQSALRYTSDEQTCSMRNLAELETKVEPMGEFKVKLEAEVAKPDQSHLTARPRSSRSSAPPTGAHGRREGHHRGAHPPP